MSNMITKETANTSTKIPEKPRYLTEVLSSLAEFSFLIDDDNLRLSRCSALSSSLSRLRNFSSVFKISELHLQEQALPSVVWSPVVLNVSAVAVEDCRLSVVSVSNVLAV